MARYLLLFVDGIGLAPAGATNPFAIEPMPALSALLGGPLTSERVGGGGGWRLEALDATLGVPGLPQSATGQTALFTGANAAAELGRHVPALPGPQLGRILAQRSLFQSLGALGRSAVFANPFSPRYFEEVAARRRRHSATTLAALAGRERLRDLDDLAAGRACTWDVTGESFRRWEPGVEPVVPAEAGRRLGALAAGHDFTLWETFMTDLAGHARWGFTAAEALRRLDGLIGGLLGVRADDLTVLMVSDHGNLEESEHRRHTRNPVPLLAVGPDAGAFAGVERIDRLAPRILERLGAAAAG